MTAKKSVKPADVVEPEIVDDLVEPTPAEGEVKEETEGAEGPRVFTIDIDGEAVELEDRWTRDNPPGALMFMNKAESAAKYAPGLLEQVIGEDQIDKLLEAGIDIEEFGEVVAAWAEDRGLKNG